MGVREKIEILITYLQYLGLIFTINVQWPSQLDVTLGFFSRFFLNLGLNLPFVPSFEFRTYFTIIVVLVPLVFTLSMLLIFKPLLTMIWYAAFLLGVGFVLIGAIPTYLLPNDSLSSPAPNTSYMYTGVLLIGICTFLYLANLITQRRLRDTNIGKLSAEQIEAQLKFAPKPPTYVFWARGFFAAVFIVVGLMLSHQIVFSKDYTTLSQFVPLASVLGWCLVSLGVILLLVLVLSFSGKGRLFLKNCGSFLRAKLTMLLLLLLTVLYLPIITTLLGGLYCVPESCSSTNEMPERTIFLGMSPASLSSSFSCMDCTFPKGCAAGSPTVCPPTRDWRLQLDYTLSCTTDLLPYYIPAAILMFFGFVCGVPFLFHRLTQRCTSVLEEIPTSSSCVTAEDRWEERTALSDNSAKFLFSSFERPYRYWKLIQLFAKLLLVVLIVFFATNSVVALGGMAVIHFSFFVLSAAVGPFINTGEDMLAATSSFCAFLTACFGIGLLTTGTLPGWIVWVILACDIALPLLAVLVSAVILELRSSKKQEEQKRKMQLRAKARQLRLQAYQQARFEQQLFWANPALAAQYYGDLSQQQQQQQQQHGRLPSVVAPMTGAGSPYGDDSSMYGGGVYAHGQAAAAAAAIHPQQQQYAGHPFAVPVSDTGRPVASGPSKKKSSKAAVQPVVATGELSMTEEELRREEKEQKRVRLAVIAVDRKMNTFIINLMSNFFLAMGVLAFGALVFCVIGLLYSNNPALIPGQPLRTGQGCEYMNEFQFAQYGSWASFTSSCCCQAAPSYGSYTLVEMWSCQNGRYKERIRGQDGYGDGLSIRPFCSSTFTNSGAPSFTCTNRQISINGYNVSSYAATNLW